jgi:uncharacterized protein YcfJ
MIELHRGESHMNARFLSLPLITALLAASGTAQAGRHDGDTIVRAKVIASTPVYDTINEPRQECWTETTGHETRSYRDANNTGGAVLGAIAGGLVGSTVGKGNGKVAAAAVGAATGAVIGDRWPVGSTRYESQPTQVEHCRTRDNYRQVIAGYDVLYRFQGREYSTRLPYDPGKWLALNVRFTVAENQRDQRWHTSRNEWND